MLRILDQRAAELRAELPAGAGDAVHFTERFAAAMIERFSSAGDVVLDPFAGYGTTLVVAERLGRRGVGIELLPQRAELIRARTRSRVIEGDARDLRSMDIGPVDLCLTSPPYMSAVGHPQNPLTAYQTLDGRYDVYLAELRRAFGMVRDLLTAGGHLLVNAANFQSGGEVTTLAWDVAQQLRFDFEFRGEIYLRWDELPEGITGDYCLVFRKP